MLCTIGAQGYRYLIYDFPSLKPPPLPWIILQNPHSGPMNQTRVSSCNIAWIWSWD